MKTCRPLLLCLSLIPFAACGGDGGSGGTIDGGGGGGGDGGDTIDGGGVVIPPLDDGGNPQCLDDTGAVVPCQCSDGIDNDDPPDGLIDAADPECAGPFDNDETSFATGIPGDNSDPFVQDCFFDGDSGGGNDGCRWDIRCADTMAPYEGSHCNNNSTDGCAGCRGLTPNGCDCFGCCDVYVDTNGDMVPEVYRVRIVDTCDASNITDTTACPPCEFVTDCYNPCDPCEYCIGHEPDPGCTEGPCPDGVTQCDVDGVCPDGFGCVSGCCQPIIG